MKRERKAGSEARADSGPEDATNVERLVLDEAQRELLQEAFENLVPLPRQFGELFYRRLFELDPELRSMFSDDLGRQASMLVNALTVAVMSFLEQRRGARAVQELGARHGAYGVLDHHYDTFGEALLWTFEQRFGERFTPALRAAWNHAWTEISTVMQEAARSGPPKEGGSASRAGGNP